MRDNNLRGDTPFTTYRTENSVNRVKGVLVNAGRAWLYRRGTLNGKQRKSKKSRKVEGIVRRNRQESTDSTEISPQQLQVITRLINGRSVTEATRAAGVDRTTFYLWLRSDAEFEAELNRAKLERVESIRQQLQGLVDISVSTVSEILADRNAPAAIRLKAAMSVLGAFGVQAPATIGSTDPDSIRRSRELDLFAPY